MEGPLPTQSSPNPQVLIRVSSDLCLLFSDALPKSPIRIYHPCTIDPDVVDEKDGKDEPVPRGSRDQLTAPLDEAGSRSIEEGEAPITGIAQDQVESAQSEKVKDTLTGDGCHFRVSNHTQMVFSCLSTDPPSPTKESSTLQQESYTAAQLPLAVTPVFRRTPVDQANAEPLPKREDMELIPQEEDETKSNEVDEAPSSSVVLIAEEVDELKEADELKDDSSESEKGGTEAPKRLLPLRKPSRRKSGTKIPQQPEQSEQHRIEEGTDVLEQPQEELLSDQLDQETGVSTFSESLRDNLEESKQSVLAEEFGEEDFPHVAHVCDSPGVRMNIFSQEIVHTSDEESELVCASGGGDGEAEDREDDLDDRDAMQESEEITSAHMESDELRKGASRVGSVEDGVREGKGKACIEVQDEEHTDEAEDSSVYGVEASQVVTWQCITSLPEMPH